MATTSSGQKKKYQTLTQKQADNVSECETRKFPELQDDANNFGETFEFDEELGEMSFSELDKKSKNRSTLKNLASPTFEKSLSLGKLDKNPFTKKYDAISLAESLKCESMNQSLKTHSHAFVIEPDAFEEDSKQQELLEKESRLMNALHLFENQQFDDAQKELLDLLDFFAQAKIHGRVSLINCCLADIKLETQVPVADPRSRTFPWTTSTKPTPRSRRYRQKQTKKISTSKTASSTPWAGTTTESRFTKRPWKT